METDKEPGLQFIFAAKVLLGSPMDLGMTTYAKRRISPINGGSFEGDLLKGIIIPGGADWQTIRLNGTVDVEARYTLQTDDGTSIYLQDKGMRCETESGIYMRTSAVFEVQGDRYNWLSQALFIGCGKKMADHVFVKFYKVL
ncbi:MAG: hypothetical protein RLZZ316_1536 [Bacteroidota bacterium]|jgi:hypothetical protein